METFDLIITIGCLIVGFMMLTGRGDVLLNDKDAAQRNKLYDMKKAQKGYWSCFYCDRCSICCQHACEDTDRICNLSGCCNRISGSQCCIYEEVL